MFRNVIMGWSHMSSLFNPFEETEERVEDSAKLAKLTATPKKDRKMSYAEAARVKKAVHWQNKTISAGKHPTG